MALLVVVGFDGAVGHCSIEQVKIVVSKWPEAHAELRGQVLRAVEELDARLSGKSLVNIREEGQTTNLELFEVVFYGGIAHENKDKRERFERIVCSGLFAYFAFQAFQSVLFHYRNCILRVAWSAEKYLMREGVIKEE